MPDGPWGPEHLADTLSRGDAPCPLPFTHDRLDECHYWWHGMARNYHEPKQLRWNLGAFIQAARNLTWILQAEKHLFDDFSWYEQWRSQAEEDKFLAWLNATRVHLTKRGPLSTTSWATFACVLSRDDARYSAEEEEGPLEIVVNPFVCTHALLRAGPREDHPHEIERHWEIEGLPDHEALEACALIFDELDDLVRIAHAHLGASMHLMHGEKPAEPAGGHRFGCMDCTRAARIVRTRMTNDGEEWVDDAGDAVH